MKQISVRPVAANLTRDTEVIGKMVYLLLFRILIVFAFWVLKNSRLSIRMKLERNLNGMNN